MAATIDRRACASLVVLALVLASASDARGHVPRVDTQRYRVAADLGPAALPEEECRYLRGIHLACFDLEGVESTVRITIRDDTGQPSIGSSVEFRVRGMWSGVASAVRTCGDGAALVPIPRRAGAMLVRPVAPGIEPVCGGRDGIPVTGVVHAAFD